MCNYTHTHTHTFQLKEAGSTELPLLVVVAEMLPSSPLQLGLWAQVSQEMLAYISELSDLFALLTSK